MRVHQQIQPLAGTVKISSKKEAGHLVLDTFDISDNIVTISLCNREKVDIDLKRYSECSHSAIETYKFVPLFEKTLINGSGQAYLSLLSTSVIMSTLHSDALNDKLNRAAFFRMYKTIILLREYKLISKDDLQYLLRIESEIRSLLSRKKNLSIEELAVKRNGYANRPLEQVSDRKKRLDAIEFLRKYYASELNGNSLSLSELKEIDSYLWQALRNWAHHGNHDLTDILSRGEERRGAPRKPVGFDVDKLDPSNPKDALTLAALKKREQDRASAKRRYQTRKLAY